MDDLQSSEEVNWELCVTERDGREGFCASRVLQLDDKLPCGYLHQLSMTNDVTCL